MASEDLIGNLESILYFLFEHRRPWAVPTSLLLDAEGRLSVIYVGTVKTETILADLDKLRRDDTEWQESALPLKGRWSGASGHPNLAYLVKAYLDDGYENSAIQFIDHFGDLLATNSRFPKLLVRSGIYLRDEEARSEKASAYFRRAAKLNPNDYLAHYQLGSASEAQGQWKEALKHYQHAAQANPSSAPTQFQLALTLIQLHRSEEALPHLQQAIQGDPAVSGPHYHLAAIFLESNQLDKAIDHFRKAYELEPENLATINGLAWTLAIFPKSTPQETAEAVRLGEKARDMTNNRHPQILDTLGAAYAADGQFQKAISTAERGVRLAFQSGSKKLATEIRTRLKRYRQKQPPRNTHAP